jgi:hypothetical protein
MLFAEIDWAALGEVIWISAISGLLIAAVLGAGIVASLRASDGDGGSAVALRAVTVVSVLIVAGAVVMGIYFIAAK